MISGLIIWRLVDVQILGHKSWLSRARAVQQQQVTVKPRRGEIFDRNGQPLALTVKSYSIAIDSFDMTKPEILVDILSTHLKRSPSEIESLVYRQSYFTWIDREVNYDTAQRIKQLARDAGAQGLIFFDSWQRVYPRNELAGNILGFTGVDGQGLAGIEYSMNERLKGEPTLKTLTFGADRTPYREQIITEGAPGHNVHLTIDSTIQHIAETEINGGVNRFKANQGWVIVMEPDTGEVLALAQSRQFNPNDYQSYSPKQWKSTPISHTFEPGSILKVFTGLAALEYGAAGPDTVVNGNSPITVAGHRINNAQYRDWGQVTFSQVIQHSINTGMIRIAQKLGERQLYLYLDRLGFGHKTGIQLPGEEAGALRHVSTWSDLAIGAIPIGQSISVTGIQLVSKMAAIANGGNLVPPKIIEKITDSKGHVLQTVVTNSVGRIASRQTIAQMKTMLREVVTDGTATRAAIPGHDVCGKTGTAQKAGPKGGYMPGKYVSTFSGFFPQDDPRYVILVVLDEVGTEPVWGGATAGVIFKRIGEKIIATEK